MAKPLISEEPGQPQSVQFAHFGVLNDGSQSKASTVGAVVINVLLACVIIIITAATKKTIDNRMKLTELIAPIPVQKVEPIKPKIIPPKPPPLPEVPKLEVQAPPKIVIPVEKLPDLPKPVKMDEPKPIIAPAPPKQVVAMAAPQVVNLKATPPALVNNSAHPSAVALGSPNNPLPAPTAAGPAAIDLGNKGVAGMPSSNTGLGKPTTVNIAGSGTPGGSNKGGAAVAVVGIPHGVTGGTGPLNASGRVAGPVNLAQAIPPPAAKQQGLMTTAHNTSPKVIYKPTPEYSAEARQMHLEGVVTVHIHVLPNGTVEVVGITDGLGHGLDESARRAAQGTRFEPATDASGNPVVWDGYVKVAFQLAG